MVVSLVALNLTCVDAEEVGRLLNVAECLQAILPHLNGEECGVEELSIADQLCRGTNQFDALLPRPRRPGRIRSLGRCDRTLCGVAIALREGPNNGTINWRALLKGRTVSQPLPINEVAVARTKEGARLGETRLIALMDLLIGVGEGGVRDLQLLSHGSILIYCWRKRCATPRESTLLPPLSALDALRCAAGGAQPLQREVIEVGAEAGRRCDRLQDWRRGGGIQLLLSPATAAVEVTVLHRLL